MPTSFRKGLAWLLLGLLLAASFLLRHEAQGPDARTQDEMVYTYFGARVAREGLPAFRILFAQFNTDPALMRGPSPLRAGYIALLSRFMGSEGPQDIRTGVHLATACSVLTLALLALLALKLLGWPGAFIALTLAAVSPLDLLIARRAWQDGIFANAALLFGIACLGASGPGALPPWRGLALFASALWMLLVKESGLLVCGILGIWLAAVLWRRERSLRAPLSRLAVLAAAIIAAAGILAWLAGGWAAAGESLRHVLRTLPSDIRDPGRTERLEAPFSGVMLIDDPEGHLRTPWHGCLTGLWALSPATFLLGLLGAALALRAWRRDASGNALPLAALAWFTLSWLALASLNPKTLRWLAPLEAPLHLLAAHALLALMAWGRQRGRAWLSPAAALLLLAVACLDYANFRRLLSRRVADPTIASVTRHSLYLPSPE